MPPRKGAVRFKIRGADGELEYRKADTPGAALSKALDIAIYGGTGVWEVVEWDDVIYRVHNLEGPTFDVRVEVVRA